MRLCDWVEHWRALLYQFSDLVETQQLDVDPCPMTMEGWDELFDSWMEKENSPFYPAKSAIHGIGIFADRALVEGEMFHIPYSESDHETRFNTTLQDGTVVIPDAPFCYLNHSSTPNCQLVEDECGLYVSPLEPIAKDEELTFDYGWENNE